MPPVRNTFIASVELDAAGNGTASITMRGDVDVQHTRIVVSTATVQPVATLALNSKDFEGSYSGANDQSDTRHLMLAGDVIECSWAGGDPGAIGTLFVRGIEYPAGEGIAAVAGG